MHGLSEQTIGAYWERRAAARTDLATEEDGPFTILSPGTRNSDHGADYRDALLATPRGLLAGDVEIHRASRGWWAHRHHRDPAYNRVVLHVVYRHDAGRPAELQNGRTAPTLVLEDFISASGIPAGGGYCLETDGLLPCHDVPARLSLDSIGEILDAAGDARFEARITACRDRLIREDPAQVLYEGLLKALGYRRNAAPMHALAAALPLSRLLSAVPPHADEETRLVVWQGGILGAAGLLPSQRQLRPAGNFLKGWPARLERAWQRCGDVPALTEADWHTGVVRPANYPVRRLAAMSYLLLRHRPEGLLEGVLKDLTAGRLVVPAEGFWRENLDFGQPAVGNGPALCGASRAADILVNVVLPFAAACDGGDEAWRKYRAHPPLADNHILADLRRRLGLGRLTTARQQQGLLHLHKNRCEAGRCRGCPLA